MIQRRQRAVWPTRYIEVEGMMVKAKRPLGIRILMLVLLLLGVDILIYVSMYAMIGWSIQFPVSGPYYFLGAGVALLCLVPAGGLLSGKRWAHWFVLALAVVVGYSDYYLLARGQTFRPPDFGKYTIYGLSWYVWWLSQIVGVCIALCLPLVAGYVLLLDRATMVAFKRSTTPLEPPDKK